MALRAVCTRAARPRRWRLIPLLVMTLVPFALFVTPAPAGAADYVLNATVVDIDGKPLEGIKIVAGRTQRKGTGFVVRAEFSGVTDAAGKLRLPFSTSSSPSAQVAEQPAGRVVLPEGEIVALKRGTNTLGFTLLPAPDVTEAVPGGSVTTRLNVGEIGADGSAEVQEQTFSVGDGALDCWRAYGARLGRPVLFVQGFSLAGERVHAYEVFRQSFALVQELRKRGRDVCVLTFEDVRSPVEGHALVLQNALEKLLDPARGYGKVNVGGFSLGGLVARYALAQQEHSSPQGVSAGKVPVFFSIDAPQQGMNLQVGIQAALWTAEPAIMLGPSLHNMLLQWVAPDSFSSDDCRFPKDGSIRSTASARNAFYRSLNALNGDGYPHLSRNVAVAGGNALPRNKKKGDTVFRAQASMRVVFGSVRLCREDYKAREWDVVPGSVFPVQILPERVDSGSIRIDLDTFMEPTLVPTASALDVRDGVPKFDRFFVPELAAGRTLRHGDPIPGATEFLLWQLTDVPTTEIALDPAAPASGWHRGPVTLTLRGIVPHDYNDLLAIEVRRGADGAWNASNGPFPLVLRIAEEGVHPIAARSLVAAGNRDDTPAEVTVRIDATAPALAIERPAGTSYEAGHSGKIAVTATDALSGIAPDSLSLKLNGQAIAGSELPLKALAAGDYVLEALARDVAGNTASAEFRFSIVPKT